MIKATDYMHIFHRIQNDEPEKCLNAVDHGYPDSI